jgi:hypothetical protein
MELGDHPQVRRGFLQRLLCSALAETSLEHREWMARRIFERGSPRRAEITCRRSHEEECRVDVFE